MATKIIFLIGLLCMGLMAMPPAQASPGPAAGECQQYVHQAVAGISLVINTGDNEAWSNNPGCGIARSAVEVFQWTGEYSGPAFLTAGTVVWAVASGGTFTGCTLGSISQFTSSNAAATSNIATAIITMTSTECRGALIATVTVSAAFSWIAIFPVNIRVEQPNQMYLCNASGLTDNAFVPSGSACTTPNMNNALSGTINTVVSGALTLSGTLNVVNSGGQTISISSWPSLVAALSGGLTITDDANGWAIHQDALSGTVNVVNSGGQSIAVSSWPTLTAALSGTVNVVNSGTQHLVVDSWPTMNVAGTLTTTIAAWPNLSASVGITSWPNLNIASVPTITINDQVHILDSVALHQILDSGQLNLTGITINQTVGAMNLTFPRELAIQLCGPGFIDTGICHPVSFNGTATATVVATTHSLEWPAILALVIFVLIIVWAEIKKEKELYLLAVLVGAFEVLFLWPDITTQIRTLLIAITAFLAYRLWTTVNAENESD